MDRQCKKIFQDKFMKFFKDKLSNHISSDIKRNINEVETDFENSGVRGGNKLRTYKLFEQKFSLKPLPPHDYQQKEWKKVIKIKMWKPLSRD